MKDIQESVIQELLAFITQIETLLIKMLLIFFICVVIAQAFLLMSEENQALVNKAVQYEGVFLEDQIDEKATLNKKLAI